MPGEWTASASTQASATRGRSESKPEGPAATSSTRLQVETSNASPTSARCTRARRKSGRLAASSTNFSRTPMGAVRCERPTTTIIDCPPRACPHDVHEQDEQHAEHAGNRAVGGLSPAKISSVPQHQHRCEQEPSRVTEQRTQRFGATEVAQWVAEHGTSDHPEGEQWKTREQQAMRGGVERVERRQARTHGSDALFGA